jgi:multisubunit Na+/H+ antiporter MnhB subunit
MNIGLAFDLLLCLLVIAVSLGAILGRHLFTGVALYIVYGLLIAIAWVRLGAVDVALTEAAIGAGLTGVLLLGAVSRLGDPAAHALRLRPLALVSCLAVGAGLCWAVVDLAVTTSGLRRQVEAEITRSGASNPVTAVLLNFRSYDTLLETLVLLLALVGVWSLTPEGSWGDRPGLRQHVRKGGVLATFGRFLPPFGLIVGIYLVWVGSSSPGGAFQAGTVLAAVWLLAMMAALAEPPRLTSRTLRWLLAAGPMLFLTIGLYGLARGAFLAYPPAAAKAIILAIEFALTVSIAASLALLVLGPARSRS